MNEAIRQKMADVWQIIQRLPDKDQDKLLDWAYRKAMLAKNVKTRPEPKADASRRNFDGGHD